METNYLENFFRYLGVSFFIIGLLLNYGDKYVPEPILRFIRYGRANISKVKKQNYTLLQVIEIPKSWFAHFYLFTVICQCFILFTIVNVYGIRDFGSELANRIYSFLLNTLTLIGGNSTIETVGPLTTILTVSLFLVHITRRLYETWFVCVYSNTKMNIIHYILAFIHYSGSMLSIISHSQGFVSQKSKLASGYILSGQEQELTIWFALGVILFIYGSIEQNKAHRGFAKLRKGKDQKVTSFAHKIPSGGLFDIISCPNYFAEMVLYIAFMMMFNFQNRCWNAVTLWVIVNQITSGVMNHKWYLKTFPSYPKERKAVIPYLW